LSRIELDWNASAPLHPAAARVLTSFSAEAHLGNPSSIHHEGREARRRVDDARDRIAAVLGCQPRDLVFTSGGSEANALGVWGTCASSNPPWTEQRLAATAIEHPSLLASLHQIERLGASVSLLPVTPDGVVDLGAARARIAPGTRLVAAMLANNETGAIQPVAELAELAHSAGARVLCDAVQAAGRVPLRPEALGADLLTLSGHKFGAGPGFGLLYVRPGLRIEPMVAGHQERERRGGTENVAAICAAAAALEAVEADRERQSTVQATLRDRLQAGLRMLPGVSIHSASVARLCNTVSARFEGAEGEALVIGLDLEGVAVSTGAACASGSLEPSHVLRAMGLSAVEAASSLRFSLGSRTTATDIDRLLVLLPPILEAARRANVA
jgi:cysteine desulfurase